ncbi:unnamed protein product [Clonostachys rosea]|uniref:Tubulin-specific chaperone A n=1 Tax=Bionectria ochroleuca TaxID=29856 RepID=A0ABY6UDG3_BIOOC|nr:unnamed protein product [Clonostachys rosea]
MPAPSPLVIATGAVLRLVKEENSYHKELVDQEKKVKALEDKIASGQGSEDGNDEYMLKQQKLAVDETKAVFDPLRKRLADAVAKLEDQVALAADGAASETELQNANDALAKAKEAQNEA